jgi:hypothetical protein
MIRETFQQSAFNTEAILPYELRFNDFGLAMQDVYDFFFDVNGLLIEKGLPRLDDFLRPAAMSGVISDMLTVSLARHSRTLVENKFHNGHPDLVVRGRYPDDSAKSGLEGVEVKSTRKKGGAVDTHGAREQWLCVFVYETDNETQPASERNAMRFSEIYLNHVSKTDFRKNERSELGTRTATLDKAGLSKFRENWIYKLQT